jgi:hypothetical protein
MLIPTKMFPVAVMLIIFSWLFYIPFFIWKKHVLRRMLIIHFTVLFHIVLLVLPFFSVFTLVLLVPFMMFGYVRFLKFIFRHHFIEFPNPQSVEPVFREEKLKLELENDLGHAH